MFKIDLHTHSVASSDGGLKGSDFAQMLENGGLDVVAITDHNTIDFALKLKGKLGDKIIVGEEIDTNEGELVGLYLKTPIRSGLSARETAEKIHNQGGLVLVPHPFEKIRHGMQLNELNDIADLIDIVEVHNGRALLHYKHKQALLWAAKNLKAVATCSDAHGRSGWGKSFSIVDPAPTKANLVELLSHATHQQKFIGVRGIFYPKINRLLRK
jgi:predicted metal-dependent phosphoesterase TrpH